MSRYLIPSKNPRYEVTVGFDDPLETFFAMVADLGEQDDVYPLWVGTSLREVTSIETLEKTIEPYGNLPGTVKSRLLYDFENRVEPSPLQKLLRGLAADK